LIEEKGASKNFLVRGDMDIPIISDGFPGLIEWGMSGWKQIDCIG